MKCIHSAHAHQQAYFVNASNLRTTWTDILPPHTKSALFILTPVAVRTTLVCPPPARASLYYSYNSALLLTRTCVQVYTIDVRESLAGENE